jgi:hypothetical protein
MKEDVMGEHDCDCGICNFCNGMSYDSELETDESGAMLVQVIDPNKDKIIRGLSKIIPPMNVEEIILLNRLREESGLIKIAAKHEAKNKKLWSRCLADARGRFKVCPSAYCNAFASRLYKKKGGTWKTVKTKSRGK